MKWYIGFDDIGFDLVDRDCVDIIDFVDVLEREMEGFVGGLGRGFDGVDGFEKGFIFGNIGFGFFGLFFVLGYVVWKVRKIFCNIRCNFIYLVVFFNMLLLC